MIGVSLQYFKIHLAPINLLIYQFGSGGFHQPLSSRSAVPPVTGLHAASLDSPDLLLCLISLEVFFTFLSFDTM